MPKQLLTIFLCKQDWISGMMGNLGNEIEILNEIFLEPLFKKNEIDKINLK